MVIFVWYKKKSKDISVRFGVLILFGSEVGVMFVCVGLFIVGVRFMLLLFIRVVSWLFSGLFCFEKVFDCCG